MVDPWAFRFYPTTGIYVGAQSGNVVNITTNGQCIVLPTGNTNFCGAPAQSAATGISVLSNTNVTSSEIQGIVIDIPGILNPFESAAASISNSKFCVINAPQELTNQIVNTNICFDMTDQFGSLPATPGVTITPPITFTMVSTTTNQVAPDCFATDATVISDAFTDESWVRGADGNFVQTGF